MNADQVGTLVTRFWEAEASLRSPVRDERMRTKSWDGDLYRVDEEVEAAMLDPEVADRFVLAAAVFAGRPDEDWVVAALAGPTEDAVRRGDQKILERLLQQGLDVALAERIRQLIG
jgi:hypothetical protein